MNITITSIGDINMVRLSGRLDSESSALLQQTLQPLAKGGGKIVIDMKEVQFVASAHFYMVRKFHAELERSGGRLAMINVLDAVKRAYDMTGFSEYIPQFESEEAAIIALSKTE